MPKVSGIFDTFNNLDKISPEEIFINLKSPPDLKYFQNYLANRIIYPQAIPLTKPEVDLDLRILLQGLKQTKSFYKPFERQILIPDSFIQRFPNLVDLVWIFVQAFKPTTVTSLVAVSNIDEVLGTYLPVQFLTTSGLLELSVEDKTYRLKAVFSQIPCQRSHCDISFNSQEVKVMGKTSGVLEVAGGRLGLIVDGRINGPFS